jgi:hypothetical protein
VTCPGCHESLLVLVERNATFDSPQQTDPVMLPLVEPVQRNRPMATHMPRPAPEPTVPLEVAFPNGAGSVRTVVTQKTADDVTKFAIGGFLVAIGMVLLWILTGGRFKPRS